jgi:hypothetical protein
MKTLRVSLILTAVCALLIGSAPLTANSRPVPRHKEKEEDLSPATRRELARVRAATAQYHDIERAEDHGYVNINIFESGEGFHWEKGSLVDGVFALDKPEDLIYAAIPHKHGLKLVAVEYIVPFDCDGPVPPAPAGFTGDADVWEALNEDGFCFWKLTVWVWMDNPDGIFASSNPLLP